MDFAAPMDWMCERSSLDATGKTVQEHQELTVENFLLLRKELGRRVIPVLQGDTMDSYHRCVEMYDNAGVQLQLEDRVGLGSVCRRQSTNEIVNLCSELGELPLHGFGVKTKGLQQLPPGTFRSVDSLSWSFAARYGEPLPGCTHRACSSCFLYASKWRDNLFRSTEGLE
jgi:hypothetical protein